VPRLADWCAIEIRTPAGTGEQVAVAHVDPQKVELAWEMRRRYPYHPDAPTGVPAVLRTGRPELYREVSDEMLVAGSHDAEHLRLARALGLKSGLVVPLAGRRGTLGAITLVTADSGRLLDEEDLAEAIDLGARAGLAVENALLYGEAQHAVRLRDDFLSVAGHELRTPLAALQLLMESLDRMAQKDDPRLKERLAERLGKAASQIARLDRLIAELLDVSRLSTARLALDRESIELGAVVAEVVDRFHEQAERAGSVLTVTLEPEVRGQWDRLRLDQVITNLVSNALKYGAGRPVEVTLRRASTGAILEVTDHGIGVRAGDQERIFGRFERAVARDYGGLGLGLWIVRQIVEAHGGRVTLRSTPDKETKFTVEIPAVP
jgi:signal transduction histidine kinase